MKRVERVLCIVGALLLSVLIVAPTAQAQAPRMNGASGFWSNEPPSSSANQVPNILKNIGIDQRLNQQVPLDVPFRDEHGRTVRLGDYSGRRPVVLMLVYYECPMLCIQVLNGVTAAFKTLNFTAGKEFEVVTVSFNPRETPVLAAAKKATYMARYNRPEAGAGWHFLVGTQPSIDALTKAVGFRYVFDPATQQYAHTTAVMVLTPQGKISRYLYGIEYSPRDLRLGIIEAASGKIGSVADQILLYCYHYDPKAGAYSLMVVRLVRLAGVVTVAAIALLILVLRKRERSAAAPGDGKAKAAESSQ